VSCRNFKERQSRRLNWMIQQELAEQRLREDTEQAEATISNQSDTFDSPTPDDNEKEVST
jgi:hypothetical protein